MCLGAISLGIRYRNDNFAEQRAIVFFLRVLLLSSGFVIIRVVTVFTSSRYLSSFVRIIICIHVLPGPFPLLRQISLKIQTVFTISLDFDSQNNLCG